MAIKLAKYKQVMIFMYNSGTRTINIHDVVVFGFAPNYNAAYSCMRYIEDLGFAVKLNMVGNEPCTGLYWLTDYGMARVKDFIKDINSIQMQNDEDELDLDEEMSSEEFFYGSEDDEEDGCEDEEPVQPAWQVAYDAAMKAYASAMDAYKFAMANI